MGNGLVRKPSAANTLGTPNICSLRPALNYRSAILQALYSTATKPNTSTRTANSDATHAIHPLQSPGNVRLCRAAEGPAAVAGGGGWPPAWTELERSEAGRGGAARHLDEVSDAVGTTRVQQLPQLVPAAVHPLCVRKDELHLLREAERRVGVHRERCCATYDQQ